MNYARRQQYRRISRAAAGAAGGGVATLVAAALVSGGARSLGGIVLLVALGLGLYSRHWLSLARRSRVGARSEDAVQCALAPLQAEGWRLRHSLPWKGRGDIDSVAIAPGGIAIAIETKCPDVRSSSSRSGARAGGLAVTTQAKVGSQRGARRRVHRSGAGRRAGRARRPSGLGRPVGPCPSRGRYLQGRAAANVERSRRVVAAEFGALGGRSRSRAPTSPDRRSPPRSGP